MSEELVPRDFVFTGRRLIDTGVIGCATRVIIEDELSTKEQIWDWKPMHARWVVGGVYTGAKFNATQVIGLGAARFTKRWSDAASVALWEAKDEEANIEHKSHRAQLNAKKQRVIDDAMHVVREMYSRIPSYTDKAVFEAQVLRSLRKPPKD